MTIISRRKLLRYLIALPLAGVSSHLAFADGDNDSGDSDSGGDNDNDKDNQKSVSTTPQQNVSPNGSSLTQNDALDAVKNGKAASLTLLLAFMTLNYPGEVLDVRLRTVNKQYIYEVKYLFNKTQLRVLKLEAKTLKKL
jgi:uncharacterized membrane protein YkoI